MNICVLIASSSKTSRLILAYALRRVGISSLSFPDSTSLCLALLEEMQGASPMVLILERDFPKGQPDSFEVIRRTRKRYPQIAIFLCIRHDDVFNRLKAKTIGVGYLKKPFQIVMVQEVISRYCTLLDSHLARTEYWSRRTPDFIQERSSHPWGWPNTLVRKHVYSQMG